MGSKLPTIALVAGFVVMLAGCTMSVNSVPMGGVPLQKLETKATYDILGPAVGTSSGGYILGFIPIGVEKKSGSVAGDSVVSMGLFGPQSYSLLSPVDRAALYNAIESKPGADALLAPRWERVKKNYIVYVETTATVKGKAIRYNQSAE